MTRTSLISWIVLLWACASVGKPAAAADKQDRLNNDLMNAIVGTETQDQDPDLACRLIEAGADPNFKADRSSALYYAVAFRGDFMKVVELLIKRGANVNEKCIGGETPLFSACETSNVNAVQYLIDHGAKVSAATPLGLTPLHVAAASVRATDAEEVIRILIEHGAKTNAKDSDGATPSDFARRTADHSHLADLIDKLAQKQKVNTTQPADGK